MKKDKKRNTRTYSTEFKNSAVQLALRSPSIAVAAKELAVPAPSLNTWVSQFKEGRLSSVPIDLPVSEDQPIDPATAKQLKENLISRWR